MIIYRDLLSNDELFCDAYKISTEDEGFMISCEGKMTTMKVGGGVSADLIGANPSQEEGGDEFSEDAETKSGIDVIMAQNLEDRSSFFTSKKVLQTYIKKWAKNVADALANEDKQKCDTFKKNCTAKIKNFVDKWDPDRDVTVYTGANFDPGECNCSPLIGVWHEDGMGLTLFAIREGLIEEKF